MRRLASIPVPSSFSRLLHLQITTQPLSSFTSSSLRFSTSARCCSSSLAVQPLRYAVLRAFVPKGFYEARHLVKVLYRRLSLQLNHSSASPLIDIPFDLDTSLTSESRKVFYGKKQKLRRYSSLLRKFASGRALAHGKAVHGHILRRCVELDSHLWVSLLNFYAKCGSLVAAHHVFAEIPGRDVVSWTTLIVGHVSKGCVQDGEELFSRMIRDGLKPNEYTSAACLRGCSICFDLVFGKQVHCQVIRLGLATEYYVGSALVELYAKCNQMELAASVFSSLPKQNAVLWNLMLNGYVLTGKADEVMSLFCRLKESTIKFENCTLSSVLKCCASSGRLREGRILHCAAIKLGSDSDNVIGCGLIDTYFKCSVAADALKVFSRIKEPDAVTWTAVISCLDKQGDGHEAARLFNIMRQRGLKPNLFTFTSLICAASNPGELRYGKSIHALIYKYGYDGDELDKIFSNSLISMYLKNGSTYDGLQVFDGMREKDIVSYNSLLLGPQGPRVLLQMLSMDFKLNVSTFLSVLKYCSDMEDDTFGRQVHTHAVKRNIAGDKLVGTTLIDMYAKTRCLDDAVLAFRTLTDRDVLTWTAIISGLMRCDLVEKGLMYFVLMQQEGIRPNEFTLATCLSGCCRIASLCNGKVLHSVAVKGGHLLDDFVVNGLINMYGKCGSIEDAASLFRESKSHDLALWNSIICLYSQHFQGKNALTVFKLMLDEGIWPDQITFKGVLAACSRLGLIDEGKWHFRSMSESFGVETTTEHCACMVDMLGQAGRFDEVESFIKEMEISQSVPVWEAVLGTCEMHKNENLGRRAAERLFELDPEEASNYVLLSNIFSAKNHWDGVEMVRGLMTKRGVKKERACSWVEVDGAVHVFNSRDFSHPKLGQIYVKLEELGKQLALAGYKPKTEHVLQNVSEREKKEYLQNHSERLALAFVLISSIFMKSIRIFKNNRICGDCHEMMRMTSEITNREIIISGIHHFHNFKNGLCSCQGGTSSVWKRPNHRGWIKELSCRAKFIANNNPQAKSRFLHVIKELIFNFLTLVAGVPGPEQIYWPTDL